MLFSSKEVNPKDAGGTQQLPLNSVYTKGLQCVLLAPPHYGSLADVSFSCAMSCNSLFVCIFIRVCSTVFTDICVHLLTPYKSLLSMYMLNVLLECLSASPVVLLLRFHYKCFPAFVSPILDNVRTHKHNTCTLNCSVLFRYILLCCFCTHRLF